MYIEVNDLQGWDAVIDQGYSYPIVGVKGSAMIDPRECGVKPTVLGYSYWRQYRCTYTVLAGSLFLTTLLIQLERLLTGERVAVPQILGQVPDRCVLSSREMSANFFSNGKLLLTQDIQCEIEAWNFKLCDRTDPVPFTGGLLLGDGLLTNYSSPIGLNRPNLYQFLYELTFEAGQLTSKVDRSAATATLRQLLNTVIERPLSPEEQTIWQNDLKPWLGPYLDSANLLYADLDEEY
ncbi:MAG TPA: hypothetical protein V6D29_06270 [Leptolyngbyaceae cyanobacterium]